MSNGQIPFDAEAEKAILGGILLNNDLISEVEQGLADDDFLLITHQHIFRSTRNLHTQGMGIDPITLKADLEARGVFDQIGGITYLSSLIDGVPRTDTLAPYIRIVTQKARERKSLSLLRDGIDAIIEGDEAPDAVIERTARQLVTLLDSATKTNDWQGFYSSLDALFDAVLFESESIFTGVRRGDVAGLLAVTNYGKSTLLLNLCLSLSAGQVCLPFLPVVEKLRRILFLDCESPASEFRNDLKVMLRQVRHSEIARKNFIPIVDASIADEPLCLSRHLHFEYLVKLAKAYQVDVVVIDTAASAFELQDENSNAEVTRKVMNPLKHLAREANCAVIFTHHIGKANETQSGEGAYKGRGTSAFGALSRTVFLLEKDASKGEGYVVLSCPKSKGAAIEPTLLKLNPEQRWFEICVEKPTPKAEPLTAQDIADFIETHGDASTDEIKRHFKDRAASRTVATRIKEAEQLSLVHKPNQKARWRLCNDEEGSFDDLPQAAENATDSAFVQSATSIGIAQMHKPERKAQVEIVPCQCGSSGLRFNHCDRCEEFLT